LIIEFLDKFASNRILGSRILGSRILGSRILGSRFRKPPEGRIFPGLPIRRLAE
jgi:hypothetical protein